MVCVVGEHVSLWATCPVDRFCYREEMMSIGLLERFWFGSRASSISEHSAAIT